LTTIVKLKKQTCKSTEPKTTYLYLRVNMISYSFDKL